MTPRQYLSPILWTVGSSLLILITAYFLEGPLGVDRGSLLQTAGEIVGGIATVGAAIVAWKAIRHQIARDDEVAKNQINARLNAIFHEMAAIALAIRNEEKELRRIYKMVRKKDVEVDYTLRGFQQRVIWPKAPIYEGAADAVAQLPAEAAKEVITFYSAAWRTFQLMTQQEIFITSSASIADKDKSRSEMIAYTLRALNEAILSAYVARGHIAEKTKISTRAGIDMCEQERAERAAAAKSKKIYLIEES